MQDVSGYGSSLNIIADKTFPQGFDVTEFADDADPFDTPDLKVGDGKVGLNGTLITWTTAAAIIVAVSVVPGSVDDQNLSILLEANRAGKGKFPVKDSIVLTQILPNGKQTQMAPGKITDGPPGDSISSAGRIKSKTYKFMFENKSGSY